MKDQKHSNHGPIRAPTSFKNGIRLNSSNGSDHDSDDENYALHNTTKSKPFLSTMHEKLNNIPTTSQRDKNVTGFSIVYLIPSTSVLFKSFFGITISLYVMNQQRLLPKPISRIVSKCLFWPTLPITYARRIGTSWITSIDDTVVMGGAPFAFVNLPEKLYNVYGVRGVINMCEEYSGPLKQYKNIGMKSLHLPTVDHFEPSVADMEEAIHFIKTFQQSTTDENGEKVPAKVYVHCRAGHGRSAAIVLAWLLSKDPNANLKELNDDLSKLRNVRRSLWKQPNLIRLQKRLQIEHETESPKTDVRNDSSA